MKKLKKVLALILTLAMCSSMLAACGNGSKEETTEGTTKAAETTTKGAEGESTTASEGGDSATATDEATWKNNTDPVKLSWYINFSWFTRTWGTDQTSQYITEKTGVDIEYIVPAGNEAEKMSTMIASETLPDLVTIGWYEAAVNQMIDAGQLYSLNELADQYDPYFYKVADSQKLGWYQKEDGNTYGYPNASISPASFEATKGTPAASSNQTFLVRKDIYEAIGSPNMTTQEGFLAALAKAKEMYPEVDGQPLIPLAFQEFGDNGNPALEKYLQNFLAIPFEKDGQLYDKTTDPEYVSWLKTMRKANEQGLISKDVFIDKRPQMEEKISQGRYFAMIFYSQDMIGQNTERYNRNDDSYYIAVDGPMNSNGAKPTLEAGGIGGWTLTMISKNCKNPDRAIQFLSYLISEEGQHDIKLGAPGLWETVDGKDQITQEALAIALADKNKFEMELGADDTHWMLMDNAMQDAKWSVEKAQPLKQTHDWTIPYAAYQATYTGCNAEDDAGDAGTTEFDNMNKIKAKWGTTLPKLIMAKSDEEFDNYFKEFTDYRDKNGYDAIMQIKNAKLQTNKSKLGLN